MRIEQRVDDLDWDAVFAGLDDVGIAPLGQILDDDECRELGALYDDGSLFRSTIDMARHRFGQGEYRYFAHPLPDDRRGASSVVLAAPAPDRT